MTARFMVDALMILGLLAEVGVTCSVSKRGNLWDDSAMERFFSSLETKRLRRTVYRTRREAPHDTFDYIERFYNPRRRHSTIGMPSPADFEANAAVSVSELTG